MSEIVNRLPVVGGAVRIVRIAGGNFPHSKVRPS